MDKKTKYAIGTVAAMGTILAAFALPAFAQVTTGVGLSANVAATTSVGVAGLRARLGANASGTIRADVLSQAVTRGDTEITNRINALNALETRVNAMEKLSSAEKASLSTEIEAQVTAMTSLQAEISADQASNNTSSLKTDIQSITKTYRIYALILPQGEIAAASDRVMTITGAMTTLAADMQTRITADQNAGVDMSASVSALADMNAKIADANTQAEAAVNGTESLQPDNGDATVMASNVAALKLARTDIQTAQKDLVAARQDATTIIAAVKAEDK